MDRKLPLRTGVSRMGAMMLAGLTIFACTGLPGTALARQDDAAQTGHEDERHGQPDTLDRAGDIAVQPVRDIGIAQKEIPPILQEAVAQPYEVPRRASCQWMREEHAKLDAALGPDFDSNAQNNQGKAEQLALAGGEAIVNSLIPFRGIVREVSGAASADRRRLIAINAGLARRGYIRGMAAARSCTIQVAPAR